jgi:hypothetical protein
VITDMWSITSNNVQRAKEELQRRRSEFETRYAEEKQALDGEFAMIETLERAAAEFILKHARKNGASAAEPPSAPPGADGDSGDRENGGEGSASAAPTRPAERGAADDGLKAAAAPPAVENGLAGTGEIAVGLDILKPGSRWRLYRGSDRLTGPEATASDISLSTG